MELTELKGISDKRRADLEKMNIHSVEELVRYYPKNYIDLTSQTPIYEAYHNDMVLTPCEVIQVKPVFSARIRYVKAFCMQNGYGFTAVWFNMPYVAQRLKAGEYLFYGRVQNKYGQVSIVNPSFEPLDKNYRLKGIVPVYTVKGSLTQGVLRSLIRSALEKVSLETVIPYPVCNKYELMPLIKAYWQVHFPDSLEEKVQASERIAVEEYFVLISAFRIIKGDKETVRARKYTCTAQDVKDFSERFGFEFTPGQKKAVNEIYTNLHSPVGMNRLLQGDVGSGKTAVALCGIFMAVKSGFQAAFLSPTEVLAEQNFHLLERYFPDYKIGFLSGTTPAKEKRALKAAFQSGEIDVLCGTHAVIQSDVEAKELAFCVCDEQHRFGVAQRNALTEKGDTVDMLVMSATPIPRTLSLIFYGDLDVTTIPDKPKERAPVSTSVIPDSRYEDMLAYIARQAQSGKQAYFVCPQIEGDEDGTVMSVKELYTDLCAKMPQVRFALLHGKMKDKEKNDVMLRFKNHEYDCLVSTTVIEVGVDVPNATVMVIYNAERFGLSQLHQLRGRVGRGAEQSYCFLLCGTNGEDAKQRLDILKKSADGFEIAQQDLAMRGGGDFLGTRQSGKFLNEIKNLQYSPEAIFLAKRLSDEATNGKYDTEKLRDAAIRKYNSLKDVVLN